MKPLMTALSLAASALVLGGCSNDPSILATTIADLNTVTRCSLTFCSSRAIH